LTALFKVEKTLTQVAALPFVEARTGIEVLLITSRRRKRWIIPRGWPVDGMSFAAAAAREAEEEAGVHGPIGDVAIGAYQYKKRTGTGYRVPCEVLIYPFRATHQTIVWSEKSERETRWCHLETAASLVKHDGLAAFLGDLARSPETLVKLGWDDHETR
jgi:8-oxo-dGTP pyrophosphatase MutT (NUDIX family)